MLYDLREDTICAISTPPGMGAIAVVRISGKKAFEVGDHILNKKISTAEAYNNVFCKVLDSSGEVLDEVMVAVYKGPQSYTGEDTLEISCHGSVYIQQRLLQRILGLEIRLAEPGEFTLRAYMNGKMDLTQAEAVGDLIHARSGAAHRLAIDQMKGGFGQNIKQLRDELVEFAALIELELDFSEEDVEFANREKLTELVTKVRKSISTLANSFEQGNAIKNGVPIAIIGAPNVGKSTLLNALLKEDKAIVSDIAGTTRDVVEDILTIDGVMYRFIDTAGIRKTSDKVESMGIERSYDRATNAHVVLYILDADADFEIEKRMLKAFVEKTQIDTNRMILVINKIDENPAFPIDDVSDFEHITISAKHNQNIEELVKKIVTTASVEQWEEQDFIVTNARHFNALQKAEEALQRVLEGLDAEVTNDFIAMDIRDATHHLAAIIGEVDHEDLLDHIFSNFCIGK